MSRLSQREIVLLEIGSFRIAIVEICSARRAQDVGVNSLIIRVFTWSMPGHGLCPGIICGRLSMDKGGDGAGKP